MANRPKNIVLCSDGTGNSAAKNRGTNVWKTYEALDLSCHWHDPELIEQVAFYDDGVGTEDLKPLRIAGGAFGYGLTRNVCQLYTALCHAYRLGDQVYLFGFSRGAYTVRVVAGLVVECGIIDVSGLEDRELDRLVRKAYGCFRLKFRTLQGRMLAGPDKAEKAMAAFRSRYAVKDPEHLPEGHGRVRFLGVWDTVDAIGLPFDHLADFWNQFVYPFKFPDRQLNPRIAKACHAISIDDERHTFHPVMWDESEDTDDRVEQVWFAGVHANVGGGYPKPGMSLVALDWMMTKAAEHGLRFVESERERYRQLANVHDKLYDSRAGLKLYYRYKPRDIAAICHANAVRPAIHATVLDRIALATQGYAPGNLPAAFDIAYSGKRIVTPQRVTGLSQRLGAGGPTKPLLLDKIRGWVTVRRLTHYAFLLSSLAVVGFAVGRSSDAVGQDTMIPDWAIQVIRTIVSWIPVAGDRIYDKVLLPILVYPRYGLSLLGLLIFFFVLGRVSSAALARIQSRFWRKELPSRASETGG